MTSFSRPDPIRQVQASAEKAVREASPYVEWGARAGYVAKGIVYCLVGLLATLAATGTRGGRTTGSQGALQALLDQPGGILLVSAVAVGLLGYALWCFVQALLDPEHDSRGGKGALKRVGRFVRGLVHCALVVAAIGMVTGRKQGSDGESHLERWTAWLMSFPAGAWLVGVAGACVIGYGLYQVWRGWHEKLDDQLALSAMKPELRRPTVHVSRFGLAARGVVFAVIGIGLVLAGLRANARETMGVGGALRWLADQPYGPWILGAVALGLVAYGFYEFIRARYRIIRVGR